MQTVTARSAASRFPAAMIIVLVGCVAHGLILLSESVQWDGWFIYQTHVKGHWDIFFWYYHELGHFIVPLIHRGFGLFPEFIFAYKLAAFVSILGGALLLYAICRGSGYFTRPQSLLIALIALTYPAFQVSFELIIVPYPLLYGLFLGGVWLVMQSEKAVRVVTRLLLNAAALGAFFISFGLSSLLVFYYGFLLLLHVWKQQPLGINRQTILFWIRRLPLPLLPIIYWLIKARLAPGSEFFGDYNTFVTNAPQLLEAFTRAILIPTIGTSLQSGIVLLANPILLLPSVVICVWLLLRLRRSLPAPPLLPNKQTVWLLLAGSGLLVLGLLAYVLVGKPPGLRGWETRHALLVALPMALIFAATANFLGQRLRRSFIAYALPVLLIVLFSAATIYTYVLAQASWIKDQAVIVNLRQLEPPSDLAFFSVEDRYPTQFDEHYRPYDYSAMFIAAWDRETIIGFETFYPSALIVSYLDRMRTEPRLKDFLLASEVNLDGCFGTMLIIPQTMESDLSIVLQYWQQRLFSPNTLTGFFDSLLDITISGASALQVNGDCPRG